MTATLDHYFRLADGLKLLAVSMLYLLLAQVSLTCPCLDGKVSVAWLPAGQGRGIVGVGHSACARF